MPEQGDQRTDPSSLSRRAASSQRGSRARRHKQRHFCRAAGALWCICTGRPVLQAAAPAAALIAAARSDDALPLTCTCPAGGQSLADSLRQGSGVTEGSAGYRSNGVSR
eukprot:scaffold823_cov397-Prasinococcus_capsulatus_cf.AAC.17